MSKPIANQDGKEYYTEPPVSIQIVDKKPGKATPELHYCALTGIAETPESSNRDSTDVSNRLSFSFERDKLQNSKISPSYQTDVNDEKIQKLKNDILRQFQRSIEEYDRYSTLLKALAIAMLSVNILEIIAAFFLLLVLSVQYIPSDTIMMWIGLAMLLCLCEIFVAIKAVNATQSKNMSDVRWFVCSAAAFALVFLGFGVLLVLHLIGVIPASTDKFAVEQAGRLVLVQGILTVIVMLKLFAQIGFIFFGVKLNGLLATVAEDAGRAAQSH